MRKVAIILIGMALIGLIEWWVETPSSNERLARAAIIAARDACNRNRLEFDRRLIDARDAIRRAPSDKYWELDAALNNEVTAVGCKL